MLPSIQTSDSPLNHRSCLSPNSPITALPRTALLVKFSSPAPLLGLLPVEVRGEEAMCGREMVRAEKAVGSNTGAGSSLGSDGWPARVDSGDVN